MEPRDTIQTWPSPETTSTQAVQEMAKKWLKETQITKIQVT